MLGCEAQGFRVWCLGFKVWFSILGFLFLRGQELLLLVIEIYRACAANRIMGSVWFLGFIVLLG